MKTSNYDEKKSELDRRLKAMRDILNSNTEVVDLLEKLKKIREKFKTTKGGLSKTGTMKSLLNRNNIYNVPPELEDFKPFFNNNDINIDWIDWKNRGDAYDIVSCCPFCSEKFNDDKYKKQKEVFKNTYNKTDSKNLKELLDLLESLKAYIKLEEYDNLLNRIKRDTPENSIQEIMNQIVLEFDLLIQKITRIEAFGQRQIVIADIAQLEDEIIDMKVSRENLKIFGGNLTDSIINTINYNLDELQKEVSEIKKAMGELKGILHSTINGSQNDINAFLKTAGINYEISILAEDEENSRTILKQCFTDEKTEVKDIKDHLSWGEKNAFSLILFMYYAISQKPDLIILDDPISSFDSNKKYAILHRMFKNVGKRDIAFNDNTVLLLTHDFEPITDFLVIGKLAENKVVASYIWNDDGIIHEQKINSREDVKLIFNECELIAKNTGINIISRITFLRKLCELYGCKEIWDSVYQILSSLIHNSRIQRKTGKNTYEDMESEEIKLGINKIREYISDFDYEDLRNKAFSLKAIKELYFEESNNYFKLQLFRTACEVADNGILNTTALDGGWYKFIDETYHIENDNLHYLDIIKFDIVPSYISNKVNELMQQLEH